MRCDVSTFPAATALGGRAATRQPAGAVTAIARETPPFMGRSEEHTSELQSQSNLVCRLLLEKKKREGCSPFACRPGRPAARSAQFPSPDRTRRRRGRGTAHRIPQTTSALVPRTLAPLATTLPST